MMLHEELYKTKPQYGRDAANAKRHQSWFTYTHMRIKISFVQSLWVCIPLVCSFAPQTPLLLLCTWISESTWISKLGKWTKPIDRTMPRSLGRSGLLEKQTLNAIGSIKQGTEEAKCTKKKGSDRENGRTVNESRPALDLFFVR